MGRRAQELLVIVVGAVALTSFAFGVVLIGLPLLLVAVFLLWRLPPRPDHLGVDQTASDRERRPLLRPRG